MFSSKEFRTIARDKLRGKWGRSVLVSFLAVLLGAEYFPDILINNPDYSVLLELRDPTALKDVIQYGTAFLQDKAEYLSMVYGKNITASMLLGGIAAVFVISFILSLIGDVIDLGYKKYYIDLVLENRANKAGVLFSRFGIFFKAIGLRLYMGFFIILWSLLFIIPGIIAGFRYAMAPYIMAENPDIGIREAVNMSKQMMDGHKARLFWLSLSFIGWDMLCVLTLNIGYLWLNPYMNAAQAAFYIERTGRGIPMAEPVL